MTVSITLPIPCHFFKNCFEDVLISQVTIVDSITNAVLYFVSCFSKLSVLALGVSQSNQALLSYCFCMVTGILLLMIYLPWTTKQIVSTYCWDCETVMCKSFRGRRNYKLEKCLSFLQHIVGTPITVKEVLQNFCVGAGWRQPPFSPYLCSMHQMW